MPGIDPKVIVHWLDVHPSSKPVRQKKIPFNPEKYKAIEDEMERLLKASFIKETYYRSWLSNVVWLKSLMRSGGSV